MRTPSNRDQKLLLNLFERFEEENVEFVVLRKYERLPENVPSDVDLFIRPDDFERAVELSEEVGFTGRTDGTETGSFFRRLADGAKNAGKEMLASVESATPVPELRGTGRTAIRHRRHGEVELDMVNHLRFPERGGDPVPPQVEELLLNRRERFRAWYVPSPPDELAHVIAHCVADYDRTFPDHYADKYDELCETVLSEPLYRAQFEELLVYLFDEEAPAVFDTVATDGYTTITEPLSLNERPRPSARIGAGTNR